MAKVNTNSITISGNLVGNSELRQTSNGKNMIRFTVANNRLFGGGDRVNFIPCVRFGDSVVRLNPYLLKGTLVTVSGELQVDNYTDNNGVKKISVSIIASEVEICRSKNDVATSGGASGTGWGDNTNTPQATPQAQPFQD